MIMIMCCALMLIVYMMLQACSNCLIHLIIQLMRFPVFGMNHTVPRLLLSITGVVGLCITDILNLLKQQRSYQQKQGLCNSNCFTVSAFDHYLSTYPPIYYNANLKYTNWCGFYQETSNYVHIVYLTVDGQSLGDFYYIVSDVIFGLGHLFPCDALPGEFLRIVHSQDMLIHFPLKIQKVTKLGKMNAEITAYNFKQDYINFNCFGLSYEKYMDRIIMNLIENQDKIPTHIMG